MESTSIITALLAQNEDAVCNRRRIIVLIGEVVLLLASVNPLTAQSAGKTKAAVSADNNKSDTAAANTPLPPADNSCVVLAGVPTASTPGKSGTGGKQENGDGSGGGGSAKDSGQSPTVQVTVNTIGSATASSPNTGASKNGQTKDTSVVVEPFPLPQGDTNAAQIASTLQGIFPRVVKATAVNPSLIVAVLDTSVTAAQSPATQHRAQNPTPAQAQAPRPNEGKQEPPKHPARPGASTPVQQTAPQPKGFNISTLNKEIKAYINSVAQPDLRVFAVALPAGSGGGCQVANALINAIPEIASIAAIDDSRLLVTPAPDAGGQSSELVATFGPYASAVHLQLELIKLQPAEPQNITGLLNALHRWHLECDFLTLPPPSAASSHGALAKIAPTYI